METTIVAQHAPFRGRHDSHQYSAIDFKFGRLALLSVPDPGDEKVSIR